MSKTTNMMTGLRRVTRRGLKLDTEKPKEPAKEPEKQPEDKEKETPPPPPPLRTKEDEEFNLHTARLKEPRRANPKRSSTKSIPMAHKVYYTEPEPEYYKEQAEKEKEAMSAPPKSAFLAMIDEIVETLNMRGVVRVLSGVSTRLSEIIVRSEYVSTEWNGQLHLHSFGFGVGFFLAMMFLYPYMEKYLNKWFDVFGSLFRHGSMLVIGYLIFTLLNKPAKKHETKQATPKFEHKYTELQYSVKSSEPTRPPSPTKKSRRSISRRETEPTMLPTRRGSSLTDAQMLISMTEQQQFFERAKLDGARSPRDPYDKFMSGAMREEGKREKYNNFVDEAGKKDQERQKYTNFVGATRDQIMKQRDV